MIKKFGELLIINKIFKKLQEKDQLQRREYKINFYQNRICLRTVPLFYVSGVEGFDLKNNSVFEIQEQGSHQNGNISPIVDGNIAAWMAWRTGNGDIYSALINK